MFSHIFLILMENTSLSTLAPAMTAGPAPNLAALAASHATGSAYHGVAHPSLPNYIALTSGSTQGAGSTSGVGSTHTSFIGSICLARDPGGLARHTMANTPA